MSCGDRSYRFLLVEDDPTHALLMSQCLEDLAEIEHAATHADALCALERGGVDLVLLDAGLPDGSGFDLHSRIAGQLDAPAVIFVTSDDLVEHGVEAVRLGAVDYVVKRPNYLGRMREVVEQLLPELATRRADPERRFRELVGETEAMVEARARIRQYADSDAPVLVLGETGTGKEVVARGLHRAGPRASRPFVAVNCAAIAAPLFESELFGSSRGAFTGAQRDREGLVRACSGGTLFLDEVSDMPVQVQAKLLRFLEDGSFRPVGGTREERAEVRIVAATNRSIEEAVEYGELRSDLYYRLNVLRIQLPPLRERKPDIPLLVDHFLGLAGRVKADREVLEAAMRELLEWSWPGNVRELQHVVERTLVHAGPGPLEHFKLGSAPGVSWSARETITCERLQRLLRHHGGRLRCVAENLGVSVRTVQRRMKEFGLNGRDFR